MPQLGKKETSEAISQVKNDKAPGPDRLPAAVLKSETRVTVKVLHILFRTI